MQRSLLEFQALLSGSTCFPTLPAIAWLLNYRCPDDIPTRLSRLPTSCSRTTHAPFSSMTARLPKSKEAFKVDGVEVRKYGVDEVGKYVKENLSPSSRRTRRHESKSGRRPSAVGLWRRLAGRYVNLLFSEITPG